MAHVSPLAELWPWHQVCRRAVRCLVCSVSRDQGCTVDDGCDPVVQSYWTFSDIFEEQGQQGSEFSQAFGIQSISGVPKPVYRALQLVRRLHRASLPVSLLREGMPAGDRTAQHRRHHSSTSPAAEVAVTSAVSADGARRSVEALHPERICSHWDVGPLSTSKES